MHRLLDYQTNYTDEHNDSFVFCYGNASDGLLIWPITSSSSFAILPCPKSFQDIPLRPGNASRFCAENGTWKLTDYSECSPVWNSNLPADGFHHVVVRIIYYVGYVTSVIALVFALFLFLYFRSLRCLRNTIHCHLIVTLILRNIIYLLMVQTIPLLINHNNSLSHQFACKLIVSLFNYFLVTNFFWMLVEGLYLHTLVVWALTFQKIVFWHYALLGWCVPAVVALICAIVKVKYDNNTCWLPSIYDYILIAPVLLVLFTNFVFLISIVWTLVTKLRASNSSQHLLYRKATKATVILFPLLGLTYILFIWSPTEGQIVFGYINAILQSTQGLFVAIFYCFLNAEVKNAVLKCWNRWKVERKLCKRSLASRGSTTEHLSLNWSTANEMCSYKESGWKKCNRDQPVGISNGVMMDPTDKWNDVTMEPVDR